MNISVFINLKKKNASSVLNRLLDAGKKYNIKFYLLKDMVKNSAYSTLTVSKQKFINNCQYAIVIGGDGTFISAAHLFWDKNIPLLGINVGNFGFLTEVKNEEIEENLSNLVKKKIKIEERLILDVHLKREKKIINRYKAINEAVITKGGFTKVIRLKTYADNHYIGTFSGDGVMISTPTGSTGYSLSANGPIICPTMDNIIINTICPHTLVFRPIILPGDSSIMVENITKFKDLILTIDGFEGIKLKNNDKLIIKQHKKKLKVITSSDRNFFDILREKFNWVE